MSLKPEVMWIMHFYRWTMRTILIVETKYNNLMCHLIANKVLQMMGLQINPCDAEGSLHSLEDDVDMEQRWTGV